MHSRFPFLSILFLALVLTACSSSNVVVTPEFRGMPVDNSRMALVMPALDDMNIQPRSTDANVQIDAAEHWRRIRMVFSDSLQYHARVTMVRGSVDDEMELTNRTISVGGNEWVIRLPEDGQRVGFDSGVVEYVLFLGRVDTQWEQRRRPASTEFVPGAYAPVRVPGSTVEVAEFSGVFAIWDNVNGRVLSYGHMSADVGTPRIEDATSWDLAAGQWARQVLDRTPLRRASRG
jgi:hypothetical protein